MVRRKSHFFLQSEDDLAEIQESAPGIVLLVVHKNTDYLRYVDCHNGRCKDGWTGFKVGHYELFDTLSEAMKCLLDSGKSWQKVKPQK